MRSLGVVLALALSALGCPQLLEDHFRITAGSGPDGGVPQTPQCDPYAVCEDACTDTQSNPAHCGDCGNAVGEGEICSMGTAVSADVGCGLLTLCSGGCVDTNAHPYFCGSCDVACTTGQRCMMGRCQCAAGLKSCGGVCRECCTNSDCRGDRTCSEGACELECAAPLSPCTDDCVDLNTDPKHCGFCGNDCGPGRACTDSACG